MEDWHLCLEYRYLYEMSFKKIMGMDFKIAAKKIGHTPIDRVLFSIAIKHFYHLCWDPFHCRWKALVSTLLRIGYRLDGKVATSRSTCIYSKMTEFNQYAYK